MRNNKSDNVTKKKILESASELFATNGFQNTTIKQIALNAGFKHTVLYYYFKNKDEIARIIYYTELTKILDKSYGLLGKHTLSITGKLIDLSYNIHTSILENPLLNTIFFEKVDYKNYRREKLEEIADNFIENTKSFLDFDELNFEKELVLAALLIWESSAKSVLSHIKKGTLQLNQVDGIMQLTRNLYCNVGFSSILVDEAIIEFKKYKSL